MRLGSGDYSPRPSTLTIEILASARLLDSRLEEIPTAPATPTRDAVCAPAGIRASRLSLPAEGTPMQRTTVAVVVAGALVHAVAAASADSGTGASHVRVMNRRIAAAFELARSRSEAFRVVLAAIDASDTYVVIEEGRCPESTIRSCLHMLAPGVAGARAVRIRVDSRQPLTTVVAQLAHELRHAGEIAAHPAVIDGPSLRAMYRQIGYQSCAGPQGECWETRAAQSTERLVVDQLKRFQSYTAIQP
jgi:hypothetical protein